jgi:hypothetical protein
MMVCSYLAETEKLLLGMRRGGASSRSRLFSLPQKSRKTYSESGCVARLDLQDVGASDKSGL